MSFFRSLCARPGTWRALFVVMVCLVVRLHAAADPSRLSIVFSPTDLVISGSTPRGQVALIGLMREPLGFYSRVTPVCEVLDDPDGDGTTRYEFTSKRAWKSVWGVVDLTTGDYVVAHPDRSPAKQVDVKGKGLGRGRNGKLSKLEHEGQWLQLLLVKPSGDVFQAMVVDGGPLDEDGANDNLINVSLEALDLARGKGEKPDEYHAGDVLFVIDPDELTMAVVRVK
jgi:hypothetical protein